jgi:hypothetical protein
LRELKALLRGRRNVHGIGVGHRLNDDRGAAADLDFADLDADCIVPLASHLDTIVSKIEEDIESEPP